MSRFPVNRREFFGTAAGLFAAAGFSDTLRSEDRPPVTNPRATDGDSVHEPNWDERLTMTVGPKKADLIGSSDKVIQAAVDYVARLGGGTVRILPGTFVLRNAIFLPSGLRLLGSGAESIITKIPSVTVPLADDSDWYDREITLKDATGFRVGDGICLRAKDPSNGSQTVLKRTLVARSGNRFKLDRGLRKNLWLTGKPTASSLFPLLTSERTADVVIEDLVLDGNRDHNAHLDGNHAGCVFLQDCNRYTIRNVETRNYNGDGISWQVCHDVLVENCHSHDNADLGLHPGSGSQRPLIRNNRLQRNRIGIFFCWGVRHGLAEGNTIDASRHYGISIGHRDTDNLIRHNDILRSGKVGVLFRDDTRGKDFWPNRNRLEHNRILDSGAEDGIGIDIQGKTQAISLVENELRETRKPMKRTGVRIGAEARQIDLKKNRFEGFAVAVDDRRTP